jgi:hypothetical protein
MLHSPPSSIWWMSINIPMQLGHNRCLSNYYNTFIHTL